MSVRAMEDVRSPTLAHPGVAGHLDPVFLNPLEDPALEPHQSVRTATRLSSASVHEHCYFHSFDIHWITINKERVRIRIKCFPIIVMKLRSSYNFYMCSKNIVEAKDSQEKWEKQAMGRINNI